MEVLIKRQRERNTFAQIQPVASKYETDINGWFPFESHGVSLQGYQLDDAHARRDQPAPCARSFCRFQCKSRWPSNDFCRRAEARISIPFNGGRP